MTQNRLKRRPRRLIAHFLRPALWDVAKKTHPSLSRRIDDRVRSIIAKALS